jgi:hypothetical protein
MFDRALASRTEILDRIREHERVVSSARAEQIRLLRHLVRRGTVPQTAELSALLDVSHSTARDLLEAARRTPEHSEAMDELVVGNSSFDRTVATAALIASGADDDTLAASRGRDIAGVHRLRAMQRRITRRTEREAHKQRSVRCWPSLDSASGFLDVQLTGTDWQVVTTALDRRGDDLPRLPDVSATQRRADALVALAHDYLDGTSTGTVGGAVPVVTVLVDPALAAASGGEAGAVIPGGPRVGPETLDEITCTGAVEVVVDAGTGVPLAVGPTTRVVPPKVRRFVLARDGGCTVDGCTSRYRLEVHHVIPRSEGGSHDAGNLTTLCWYHHHVEVHGSGHRIDPTGPRDRDRLVRSGRSP